MALAWFPITIVMFVAVGAWIGLALLVAEFIFDA